MYTDFEYAGKRLSDFGYTICKFGGSSDLTDVEIGCDITFSTVKNNHSSIHYNTSSSYENVYTTSLEIMKNPCNKNQDELYHINEEISLLTSWLNRREYYKFKPLTEEHNFNSIHYYGSFNVKEKTINDKVVGFTLLFTGNAPYGFGEHIINEIDMDCNDVMTSGEVVTTTDSAKVKPKNIKLFGKGKQAVIQPTNILECTSVDATQYGLTFTHVYKDRCLQYINVNGVVSIGDSGTAFFKVGTITPTEDMEVTFSGAVNGSASTYSFNLQNASNGNYLVDDIGNGSTVVLEGGVTYNAYIVCRSGATLNNVRFYPQIEKGNVKTSYKPFVGNEQSPNMNYPQKAEFLGESGSIGGKVLGKNHADTSKLEHWWGDEVVEKVDNGFYIKPISNQCKVVRIDCYMKKGNKYTLSYDVENLGSENTNAINYFIESVDGKEIYDARISETVFEPREDIKKLAIYTDVNPNVILKITNIQLEPGEVATEYEAPATEQPFTFQTPNGLRGIPLGQTIPDAIKNSPIHMSGVYWDGEQYQIADTENEDGKDVQRIIELVYDGSEGWGTYDTAGLEGFYVENLPFTDYRRHGLCTQFKVKSQTDETGNTGIWLGVHNHLLYAYKNAFYDNSLADKGLSNFKAHLNENPLVIWTWLDEPIIKERTTEETESFDSLVMNYPNTTIVNDEGAYMEVTYLQDYDNEFVICGVSDEYKTLYPNISIICKQDGDLRIKNTITRNVFEVLNCSEGETIYVNGEHKFIDSDNEIHKSTTLFNDFNYNYLDTKVTEDDFSGNLYETSIPCKIVIDYSPIRKVGL